MRERRTTIALLSLAAISIDLLVVLIISKWVSGFAFSGIFHVPSHFYPWVELASFALALILHLIFVEIIAGGQSLGRLCTGLTVQGTGTGGKLPLAKRIWRFLAILSGGGLRSLNPTQLAPHNQRPDSYLRSDWVGSVHDGMASASQRSINVGKDKPGQPRIDVISGPHAGLSAKLNTGKGSVFNIGRDPRSSHLSLEKDASVSRTHCRIAQKGTAWLLIDGAAPGKPSTHGTFVNGTRIGNAKPVQLLSDATIELGTSKLRVRI